ncbi:family 43 glycosylhydrolase [candidate division KSB1 bacterium]|nr:family 43 glycosylhydrolase [candidate division KSB1 bacterium]
MGLMRSSDINSPGDKHHFAKWLQIALLCASLFLFPSCPANAHSGQVTNVHDPCIITCGDYHYIFSTSGGIAIRRSRDLQRWHYVGEVFREIPAWGTREVAGVSNIWAPDIFYHKGTYYLYYSLSTFGSNRSCIGLATNSTLDPDDPDYNWIDAGKVIESNSSDVYNAIDPNICMDAQGKIWMSFGSFWSGIKIVELDSSTWKPPNDRLQSIASRGGDAIEAPYIIFRNGYYYLFVSFDLCCRGVNSTYRIMVGRSSKITGPFVDRDRRTMLNSGGHLVLRGDERWRGPGHCAIFLQEDADWLVYHAYDAQNNGVPTLRITRLDWDADSWPIIMENAGVQQEGSIRRLDGFFLRQNYPNPFNSLTKIAFDLGMSGYTTLKVYDINARELTTLVEETLLLGHYNVPFDASGFPPGVYLYSMQTNAFVETKKMVVLP